MDINSRIIVGVLVTITAIGALGKRTPAASDDREKKIQEAADQSAAAAKAFDAIMQVPDQAIPRDLLSRAKAVAVFPRVVKVAVSVGAEGGRGVVCRRVDAGWGPPVFLRGMGASVGAHIGAS